LEKRQGGWHIIDCNASLIVWGARIEKHDAENLRHVAQHHAGNPTRHVQSIDDTAEAEHREQVAKPFSARRAPTTTKILWAAAAPQSHGRAGGTPRIRLDEHRGVSVTRGLT
jgi:hypothetical protein